MTLYMVKVEDLKEHSSNWFLVSAATRDEVRAMCEDDESGIVEIIESPADMAQVLDHEYDKLVILTNV